MNYKPIILLIVSVFFVSGCYTQLETIERERPRANDRPTTQADDAYDTYYTEDEYHAYEEGYYDGVFDAHLGFKTYRPRPHVMRSMGFFWSRPYRGFGFSYGHYYDPYWHYAQLYDPFYYTLYGYYGYPYHYRYRHFGHFYSPWGGFGPNYVVIYNNYYGSGNSSNIVSGPRNSGVHRGTVTDVRNNRTNNRGIATRNDRTRLRGGDATSSVNQPVNRVRPGATVNQPTTRGTTRAVDRRRAASPQRAQPQRSRGNDSGNVNRTRGNSSSSSGNVNRSRGSSNSSGNVNRSRGNRNSSGNVNRSSGGRSSSTAAPARSRSSSSSSDSGNRSRSRDN